MNNKLQEWQEQLDEIENKASDKIKFIFKELNFLPPTTSSEFRDYLIDLINEIDFEDKAKQELQLLYAEVNSFIRTGHS